MKRLLFPLLILYGCGVEPNDFIQLPKGPSDPRSVLDVHRDIIDYVEVFEKKGNVSIGDVTVGFVSEFEAASTVGVCITWESPNQRHTTKVWKEVSILTSWWYEASDEERQQLIDHELGHCVLGRDHVLDIVDGFPTSVMYPYVFNESQLVHYTTHQMEYTTELFR